MAIGRREGNKDLSRRRANATPAILDTLYAFDVGGVTTPWVPCVILKVCGYWRSGVRMVDNLSAVQRQKAMRSVRNKNSQLELRVRSALHRRGLRFRLHGPNLPGRPDIVFASARVAIFLDSCFWHGCARHFRAPKSNQEFWNRKIRANVERDARVLEAYRDSQWLVCRLWEHEVDSDFDACIDRIERTVRERAGARRAR